MSKAILVIENPSLCLCCPIARWNDAKGPFECFHFGKKVTYDEFYNKRPDWCPLRELPEYKEENHTSDYSDIKNEGYNACIEEILKGAEENG